MLRINLNIAIVAMIIPRSKAAAAVAQCANIYPLSLNYQKNLTTNLSILSTSSSIVLERKRIEHLYDWDEYHQSLALGAYYWLHWISQLPGGLLARRYGTKLVFGLANLIPSILGVFLPFATRYHLYGLVVIRVIQGLISGSAWPAMHHMTAQWIPSVERSKFVSSYFGSSVGAAVTYPLCALVINSFGWESAFYVTSLIAFIWYLFWIFLVYDSPSVHPRISKHEKQYILESTLKTVTDNQKDMNVPWKQLLLSGPLWITIVGHWGVVWGFLTFMTQAPSYFNFVHGWNINAAGFLSGLPHLLRMGVSYSYSVFSDWLLKSGKMSLKNVRKLATLLATGGGAVLTLGLAFSGCQPILAIFFMMAGTAINGAVSAGTLANIVDLSPNYASVLLGFCGLVTAVSGFISPFIVGILTNHRQTVEQWRLVFIIATINLTISAIVNTIWATSDIQSWNDYREKENSDVKLEELENLNIKKLEKLESQ
ncbi:sialin-like isoform X2 [Chelonus insularis]|nr:sialin-like isoform X2 [Chelonus insularis]